MADNVHEHGLLEALLEQEKAKMQAAFNQQFQGSFARLRESLDSSRGDSEQRVNVLEKGLRTATQHIATLHNQLEVANESIQNFTEQLRAANERSNASATSSARSLAECSLISKSATRLANSLASRRTQPEVDLTSPKQKRAALHEEMLSRKRKASTERPRLSEDASRPDLVPVMAAQTANPDAGERLGHVPPESTGMNLNWTGQFTSIRTNNSNFLVDIICVSAVKYPRTLHRPWTTMVPEEVQLTARVSIYSVMKRLRQVHLDPSSDMIVLRLLPASEAGKAAFGRLFDFLNSTRQCDTRYRPGLDNVETIFLMPIPAHTSYPAVLSNMESNVLPPTPTEDMLFLVIVYEVKEADQKIVRLAWDQLINTVHSSDVEKLAAMRDIILIGHPLPILHPRGLLLSTPSQVLSTLKQWPVAIHEADPGARSDSLQHISYYMLNEARAASVDGVKLPERVFILGVTTGEGLTGEGLTGEGFASIVLVDMTAKDRHLWHLRMTREFLNKGCSGWVGLTLLRSKFPGSLAEWESSITHDNYTAQHDKMVEIVLKIERCGPLN